MNEAKGNGTTRARMDPPHQQAHPVFEAMIAEARKVASEDLVDADDLDRRRPLTAEEITAADALLDKLEEEGEVSTGLVTSAGSPAPDGIPAVPESLPGR